MSKSNEPSTQSNPEHERGINGETVATNRAGLPLPVKIEQGQSGAGKSDAVHGARANNGVYGVHHPTQDGRTQDDDVTDADLPRDGDARAAAALVDGALIDAAGVNALVTDGATDGATEAVDASGADAAAHDKHPERTSPTAGLSTLRSAVKIKGRPGGVSLELGEGDWDELILLLEERLNAAEGFFRGGRVLLDVGVRALIEENLRQVRELLEIHEMQLAVVRSTAERTLQAAAEVGVSTTNEDMHESLHVPEPPLIVPDGPPNAYTPSTYAPPPERVSTHPNHFVHRGSLRSGQVLRKTESIVIIGDVNPGAQVVSGGDVMVWGRLRGIAHAGAEGNRRAVVAAIDFVPTQLRIANLTAIAPERKETRGRGLFFWKKEPERGPEIARVIDGRIVVEPWDEGKPNGLGMWRKK